MSEPSGNSANQDAVVCVDGEVYGEPEGRLFLLGRAEPLPFRGVMQFLLLMEGRPAPGSAGVRAEGSAPSWGEEENRPRGRIATFCLRILFRQHASWQGTLTWLEGKQEGHFRSVPELLYLLHSALESLHPPDAPSP